MAQRDRALLGGTPPSDAVKYAVVPSPIGELVVWGDDGQVRGLSFADSRTAAAVDSSWDCDETAFLQTKSQLAAYFAGELTEFKLELAPRGTEFQRRVWSALREIPYGTTTTYGRLAMQLGDPRAVRAVGLANGRNPIAIIIPCHRVVGSNGSLTGYGGGLDRKEWLLAHERR
jgi:methylated-DNA-[protein]-cysteine S-methyltransferase